MKSIQFKIEQEEYVKTYLTLMNGIFNLTEMEISILAAFIKYNPDLIGTSLSRKVVAEWLNITNVAVLNNYVKKLKTKNAILITKDSHYTLHPTLHPDNYRDGIKFQFVYAQAEVL